MGISTASAGSGLEIRLLGKLSIFCDGRPVILPGSRKLVALLAYLLVAERPISRSALCDLLWDGPDDPRAELRWCLSRLRAVLGPRAREVIYVRGDWIEMDASRVDLDLRGARRVPDVSTDPREIKRALAFFRGGFLEGWQPPRSAPFEVWLTATREEYRRRHIEALRRVISQLPADDPERIAAQRRVAELAPGLDVQAVKLGPALNLPWPLDRPSIAVMPFTNIGNDRSQQYFADGLAEEIIAGLARVRALFVIAKNSSFVYKDKFIDLRDVGRDLGVRYVLEGSVRRAAGRVRITSQLADTSTGVHIWSDRFEGELGKIFELQDRITESVISAILPNLRAAEIKRARRSQLPNIESYDLLLKSLPHIYPFSKKDSNIATLLLRTAAENDPTYALSFSLLAFLCYLPLQQGWVEWDNGIVEEVKRLRDLSLRHGWDDAEVLAWAAFLGRVTGECVSNGLTLISRALNLNPNLAFAYQCGGQLHAYDGDTKTAIEYLEKSVRLDPTSVAIGRNHAFAVAYFVAGQHEKVIEYSDYALQERANSATLLMYRTASLIRVGKKTDAQKTVHDLLEIGSHWSILGVRDFFSNRLHNPFRRAGVIDEICDGLRLAGLPD